MSLTTIAVKLSNGEEWIGQHQQQLQDGANLTLVKPRRLQFVSNGKGGMGLALTPVFMCSQELESVTVPVTHVMATISVDREFEKQYLQEVTTIQLV